MTKDTAAKQNGDDRPVEPPSKGRQRDDGPDMPVGNSPPGPRWPLYLAGLVWFGWVVFLFLMMLSSRAASSV